MSQEKKRHPRAFYLALLGATMTIFGYSLVFLFPYLANLIPPPSLELLLLAGLFSAISGMVMLFAGGIMRLYRSPKPKRNYRRNISIFKHVYKIAIIGGLAWVLARIVQPLFIPVPQEILIKPPEPLIQYITFQLLYGFFIGYSIAYLLNWHYAKIPGRLPIYKAIILSLSWLAIISVIGIVLDLSNPLDYFIVSFAYYAPSHLLLGFVIGSLYKPLSTPERVHQNRL